jgi:bacteriocin-like protein
MLMKYKDFKQMSANEMKNVVGGKIPSPPVCNTSQPCSGVLNGGGSGFCRPYSPTLSCDCWNSNNVMVGPCLGD